MKVAFKEDQSGSGMKVRWERTKLGVKEARQVAASVIQERADKGLAVMKAVRMPTMKRREDISKSDLTGSEN